jgi:hypothetical protein
VINPLIGGAIFETWTGDGGDLFTEKLTTVVDIDRAAMNAITLTLTGTLSDSHGHFWTHRLNSFWASPKPAGRVARSARR